MNKDLIKSLLITSLVAIIMLLFMMPLLYFLLTDQIFGLQEEFSDLGMILTFMSLIITLIYFICKEVKG